MFGYEYRLSQKQEETEEKVSNYSFIYYNDLSIKVCDNGKFYSLKDAYDQKMLTDDEIKDIYDIHQEKYMKIFETTEK